jgi:aminoglycoside phosphotransferase family enzyme/predicted kinase
MLTPRFVYKVKKPVNFGFLDFSTLERRHHFCEREILLNRRLSPGIYLGVIPISRKGGRLVFGDDGEVVEYAVKMRRLDARWFLDRRLERGAVKPRDLDRIVARLRRFYQSQHPAGEIEAWGRIDRLRISTDENFRQTRRFIGLTLSRPAFDAIRGFTNGFFAQHIALFRSRVEERRIRDCHGDLHLEHIHLAPRALHIYDCIEFNDRLRYVDVASDVAFLAMDLDFEGRPDLSRRFEGRMAAALRDWGMPRLMDFYKCYRAFVRGKVESLHSVAPAAPAAERKASANLARRYFQLALQYAVAGSQPMVLVVMGRIASGKSTLAVSLADELGWEVFGSDRIRKQIAGLPLYHRARGITRARLYSAAATRVTYQALFRGADAASCAGRAVILDATFARREDRAALLRRFQTRGIAVRFLEVTAGNSAVKRRLLARARGRHEVSDARIEDFTALNRLYERPVELSRDFRANVRTTSSTARTLSAAFKALVQLKLRAGIERAKGTRNSVH